MSENQAAYGSSRIKPARIQAEILTQRELAERTGLAPNIISDLERGKRKVSPAWAMRIAEAVGGNWNDYLDERR